MSEHVPAPPSSTQFAEDLHLARRACSGDLLARESLAMRLTFIRSSLRVRNRASAHPLHAADIEDLEQDVLLRVFQSLPHFRGRSSLRTWVGRICERAWIDMLRHRRRAARTDWIDRHDLRTQSDPCQLERASLNAALEHLAREGPRADLWLLVLHARDGLSFESIAAREHSTPGAIKARYYRAMLRLRALFEDA